MIQQNRSRTRSPRRSNSVPTPAQIARKRDAIRMGWSTAERVRRRVDGPSKPGTDHRLQAHIRFIQFLIELEASKK